MSRETRNVEIQKTVYICDYPGCGKEWPDVLACAICEKNFCDDHWKLVKWCNEACPSWAGDEDDVSVGYICPACWEGGEPFAAKIRELTEEIKKTQEEWYDAVMIPKDMQLEGYYV